MMAKMDLIFSKKIILLFCLFLFSINFIYSQENNDSSKNDSINDEKKIKSDNKDESKNNKKENKQIITFRSKNLYVWNLNNINKIGIAFAVTGITCSVAGAGLFIYDFIGFKDIINSSETFSQYQTYYAVDIVLLASSIFLAGVGSVLFIVSIPLILNNKNKTALFIKTGKEITLGFNIKFN